MQRRNHGGLRAIKTGYIIPVDLNSLMYMNYRNIANFYETLGDEASAVEFRGKAAHMKESIYNILWSIEDSMWFDYDVLNNVRKYYLTNTPYFEAISSFLYRLMEDSQKALLSIEPLPFVG